MVDLGGYVIVLVETTDRRIRLYGAYTSASQRRRSTAKEVACLFRTQRRDHGTARAATRECFSETRAEVVLSRAGRESGPNGDRLAACAFRRFLRRFGGRPSRGLPARARLGSRGVGRGLGIDDDGPNNTRAAARSNAGLHGVLTYVYIDIAIAGPYFPTGAQGRPRGKASFVSGPDL